MFLKLPACCLKPLKVCNPDIMKRILLFWIALLLLSLHLSGQADSSLYNALPHLAPVSQGRTGTCWAFAATSLIESEVYRIQGKVVKLSEMYFVYHEYLDRVAAWADKEGKVYMEEGSESNALLRLMKEHGAVPYLAFIGRDPFKSYDHSVLIKELLQMLEKATKKKSFNKQTILRKTRAILRKHIGEPPEKFEYEGVEYTPQTFLPYLGIRLNDYFSFMSTTSLPYHQKGELVEPDNWWHNADYYNVTPDEFLLILRESIQKGFSVCICGDVSEPGLNAELETGVIVPYDLPETYFSAEAREFRMQNGSTTDDHCMHAVGVWQDEDGKYWFMVKDSGRGGFKGKHTGYRFIREDYIKLKMMNLLLYKYGASTVLDRIIK